MLVLMASPAAAIELAWPLACTLGADCFIQQYVDHDPGPEARDYTCGSATYDGHDGTDIRVKTLADMERGVDVLASHDGVVAGTRDGEPDRVVKTDADRAAVADKECGNGVLVETSDGWATQYCHMKEGSIAVKKGDAVKAGQKLGQIGASGLAAFPHLHLSVRKGKTEFDPFTGTSEGDTCETAPKGALWSSSVAGVSDYAPTALLGHGFAPGPVEIEAAESGETQAQKPDADSPALVAWMWAINLRKGDEITVSLSGPGGELAANTETIDRNKAQYLLFAGKKRKGGAWAAGEYEARVSVRRDGKAVIEQRERLKF
jgi:Peptidase family M23